MLSEHDKRRLELANWYAREAIVHDAAGEIEFAEICVTTANEYLSQLYGRDVRATRPDEVIAHCFGFIERARPPETVGA